MAFELNTQNILIIVFTLLAVVAAGGYFAYAKGLLDPVIEKITIYIAEREAKAEAKKLEGEGLSAGTSLLKDKAKDIPGSSDAADKLGGALGKALG